MNRVPAIALVFVTACFNPTFHNPTCGPNGECPGGTTCVDGTCRAPGSTDDAALDDSGTDATPDDAFIGDTAPLCLGSGAWEMCVTGAAIKDPVTLGGAFNTDTSTLCSTAVTWTSATQPDVCVVAGTTINNATTLTATGNRPLVLFATNTITQAANVTLDVASHRAGTTGAGKQPAACATFPTMPMDSTNGAGGGAAGSFITKGGNGGAGGMGATAGTAAAADTALPTVLRGGCRGQAGGTGSTGSSGPFGAGGGAIYLVAGTSITLNGTINASGAGGSGAAQSVGGGGGGGAGGMIVLHAPSITSNAAKLMANGGGGGGGGGGTQGQPGTDPNITAPLTPALGGQSGAGNGCGGGQNGRGGSGAASTVAAGDGAQGSVPDVCGGGGGGGGGGYIRSNVAITGATISPALDVVP